MEASTIENLPALVQPNRVHRALYTDPDLFELEMDRIFGHCWLFAAHESQVSKPGDFLRIRIGREDALVTHDKDGAYHVVMNRCAHRGSTVCNVENGNSASLVCPYHGWRFALDGSLAQLPHRPSMSENFDMRAPENSMMKVARVENYRGFIFANFSETGPDLKTFLGPMTDAFDNLIDRAPDGEIVQEGGIFRQQFSANWKLHHENANDTLHPGFVHESSVAAAKEDGRDYASEVYDDHQAHTQLLSNGFSVREWQQVALTGFEGGHSFMGGFYKTGILSADRSDPVSDEYRKRLMTSVGEERTAEILGMDRFNNLIWPNLNINAQYQQIRIVHPISVNETIVQAMCFRLKGAPEKMFHRAVRFLTNLNSPASMIFGDDAEIFERVQSGLERGRADWIDQSRGFGQDREIEDGMFESQGASELPLRLQYKAWLNYMSAGS